MLTNEQIAEKWAGVIYNADSEVLAEKGLRHIMTTGIYSAITEATTQQAERIEELEKILTVAGSTIFPNSCDGCVLLMQTKHTTPPTENRPEKGGEG